MGEPTHHNLIEKIPFFGERKAVATERKQIFVMLRFGLSPGLDRVWTTSYAGLHSACYLPQGSKYDIPAKRGHLNLFQLLLLLSDICLK